MCPLCKQVGHKTNKSKSCKFYEPTTNKKSNTKKQEEKSKTDEQVNATKTPREDPESKIKWKKSRAKQLLYDAIKDGRVLIEACSMSTNCHYHSSLDHTGDV